MYSPYEIEKKTITSTKNHAYRNPNMLQNNLSLYSDYANQTEQYEGFIDIGQPDNLLLFTIIWPLIAVVGILANLCVIFVMIFSAKLTSATQFFIINLAISDILFLAICPTLVLINVHKLISFDQMPGLLAKLVCKADYFSSHVNKNSINNLKNFL